MVDIFHTINLDIEQVNVELRLETNILMEVATIVISLYTRQVNAKVG